MRFAGRLLLITAAVCMLVFTAGPIRAAKAPDPVCTWTATEFRLANMNPTVPFSVTFEPYPTGTSTYPNADGTWVIPNFWTGPLTAYVWVRGHGPSLIKAGPGLNDYHVVCIAELA